MSDETGGGQRLDKWLWCARFFKTRTLATKFCLSGKIRVNKTAISKAHYSLRVGDVLTFALGPRVRVIEVRALGTRRGPATEARTLYEDLSQPPPSKDDAPAAGRPAPVARREPGSGRPTKRERRETERLRGE